MPKKRRLKSQKLKTVHRREILASQPAVLEPRFVAIEGYDTHLIRRDLFKTVFISAFILSLELAIYFVI
jgi:hypothetical protein